MKQIPAVMALWLMVAGGAGNDEKMPDLSKVVALTGRFSSAHGCPVAPYLLLTNGHVFDPHPEDSQYPLIPFRGEREDWKGVVAPLGVLWEADTAFGLPTVDFPSWYEVGEAAPAPETKVWWVAYDFRDKRKAFAPRRMDGKVLRSVGGTIFIDSETFPGSSGSCVVTEDGKVVGIIMGTFGLDNGSTITLAASVTGDWLTLPSEEKMRGKK